MRKSASFYFFIKRKPIILKDRYEYWRGVADLLGSTTQERLRVEMYKTKSSRSAADFLYRLRYLVGQPIENLQTDNGSEFAWEFERATAKLGIQRYFSRVKTPKDNPEIERFNQTLEYEWVLEFLSNVVEIPSSMFSVSSSHLPAQASFPAGEYRL